MGFINRLIMVFGSWSLAESVLGGVIALVKRKRATLESDSETARGWREEVSNGLISATIVLVYVLFSRPVPARSGTIAETMVVFLVFAMVKGFFGSRGIVSRLFRFPPTTVTWIVVSVLLTAGLLLMGAFGYFFGADANLPRPVQVQLQRPLPQLTLDFSNTCGDRYNLKLVAENSDEMLFLTGDGKPVIVDRSIVISVTFLPSESKPNPFLPRLLPVPR